mmetsp:Transcript_39072/g.91465  ORF Transcript_39072/g.91465 Transcript_39072/m.91465 type:complete len:223 (+) Transcript_39072:3602-4270(+)
MKMPCVSVPVSVLRPSRTSLYRWGCTTDSTHLKSHLAPPLAFDTYSDRASISASVSLSLYEGIWPSPLRSAFATRAASGFNSSSTGPTAPSAPAACKVWQTAHDGTTPCRNSFFPSASCALSSAASAGRTGSARPATSTDATLIACNMKRCWMVLRMIRPPSLSRRGRPSSCCCSRRRFPCAARVARCLPCRWRGWPACGCRPAAWPAARTGARHSGQGRAR